VSKSILIWVACHAVDSEGVGPNGDFMVGVNLLRNLLLGGINPRLLSIMFVSTEGGARKLAKLFPVEVAPVGLGSESGKYPLKIDDYETSAYSIKKAKETVNAVSVVMFLSASSCHFISEENLCALINQKTKVMLSGGLQGEGMPLRMGSWYPNLIKLAYKFPSFSIDERLGFDASSFGLPVTPCDRLLPPVFQERYLATAKRFAFGYYSNENAIVVVSNFLSFSSSAPYLNRTFIFVGSGYHSVVGAAADYLIGMLETSDYFARTELGTSLYLTNYKKDGEIQECCLRIQDEKRVLRILSPTLLDKALSSIHIDHYESMKNTHIQGLMSQSHGPVLCTGTMSMLEACWHKGFFFYQYLDCNIELIKAYHKSLEKELSVSLPHEASQHILQIAKLLTLATHNPSFLMLWNQLSIHSAELEILTEANLNLVRKGRDIHTHKIATLLRDLALSDEGAPSTSMASQIAPAFRPPSTLLFLGPSQVMTFSLETLFRREIVLMAQKQSAEFSPFIESVKGGLYSQALRRLCTSTCTLAYEIAVKLLDAFARGVIKLNINEKAGASEMTALHHAIRKNNDKLAELLVAHGADREIKDKEGRTPDSYKRAPKEGASLAL
jgi:hypothetical protein